jgi:hypothetical protein
LLKARTDFNISPVKSELKKIVEENGAEIYTQPEALSAALTSSGISRTEQHQIALVLENSDIASVMAKNNYAVSMTDINNIIQSVRRKTGLNEAVTAHLSEDLLYSTGCVIEAETGNVLTENGIEYKAHSFIPYEEAGREMKQLEKLLDGGAPLLPAAWETMQRLARAGVPKAFYYIGQHYYSLEKSGQSGESGDYLRCFETAAEYGVPEAAAFLGDHYYRCANPFKKSWTKAYHYYTKPGAVPLSLAERKRTMENICAQKKSNLATLVMGAVQLVLTLVFIFLFQDQGYFALGAAMLVLGALSYAGVCLYYRKNKFDGIKWLICVNYLLWGIYAAFLIWGAVR